MSLLPNSDANDKHPSLINQDEAETHYWQQQVESNQVQDQEALTRKLRDGAVVEHGPLIVSLLEVESAPVSIFAIRAFLTHGECDQLEARCTTHREIKCTARLRASQKQPQRPPIRHPAYQKHQSLISQSELRTHLWQQKQCTELAKLRTKILRQFLSGSKVQRGDYDLKIKKLAYPVFRQATLADVFEPQRTAVIISTIPLRYRYRILIEHVSSDHE